MNNSLAIIIPAYKATFLPAALDSIATQTCKDFTLYIGDDRSPHDIEAIVNRYRDKINLVYKRFETNVGGKDLVAQWERCIAMTQDEPYIWLFSDDDVMEPGCVETFFNLTDDIRKNHVVHFNIHQIDENGDVIKKPVKYPKVMTAKEYLDAKLFQRGVISFVVEFIFPRWVYEKTGGFQNFDLAWGSDFMTWLKFAEICNGIYTVDNESAKVMWRSSNENISPDKSRDVQIRKINSQIEVAQFIKSFLRRNGHSYKFNYARFVFGDIKRSLSSFKISDITILCKSFRHKVGWNIHAWFSEIVLVILKIIRHK